MDSLDVWDPAPDFGRGSGDHFVAFAHNVADLLVEVFDGLVFNFGQVVLHSVVEALDGTFRLRIVDGLSCDSGHVESMVLMNN